MAKTSKLNQIFHQITGRDLPGPTEIKSYKTSRRVIVDLPKDLRTGPPPPNFIIGNPPSDEVDSDNEQDISPLDESKISINCFTSCPPSQLARIHILEETLDQITLQLKNTQHVDKLVKSHLLNESVSIKKKISQLLIEYIASTHDRIIIRMHLQQQIDKILANPQQYADTHQINISDVPNVISRLRADMIRGERLSEDELMYEVIKDPSIVLHIIYTHALTPKILDTAFRRYPQAYSVMPDNMKSNRNRQLSLVRRDPIMIRFIEDPSEEIQLEAVRLKPMAIMYISESKRTVSARNLAYQLSNGQYGDNYHYE